MPTGDHTLSRTEADSSNVDRLRPLREAGDAAVNLGGEVGVMTAEASPPPVGDNDEADDGDSDVVLLLFIMLATISADDGTSGILLPVWMVV